jgi:hypothetical protein
VPRSPLLPEVARAAPPDLRAQHQALLVARRRTSLFWCQNSQQNLPGSIGGPISTRLSYPEFLRAELVILDLKATSILKMVIEIHSISGNRRCQPL